MKIAALMCMSTKVFVRVEVGRGAQQKTVVSNTSVVQEYSDSSNSPSPVPGCSALPLDPGRIFLGGRGKDDDASCCLDRQRSFDSCILVAALYYNGSVVFSSFLLVYV